MKEHQILRRYILVGLSVIGAITSIAGYYGNYGIPLVGIAGKGLDCQKLCQDHCAESALNKDTDDKVVGFPGLDLVPLDVSKKSPNRDSPQVSGLSYLNAVSLRRFQECSPSKLRSVPKKRRDCYQQRTFLLSRSPMVALVSFQGSGNTWLRYLLEQSTGVYTGSIYCDTSLKNYFPGEYVASGNVIVIKTHIPSTHHIPTALQNELKSKFYDKAILLVRNPFDALVSEANRRWNTQREDNHLGLASEAAFIRNSKWDWFVEYMSASWGLMLQTWLSQSDTPVLVVKYEQLLANLTAEISRILDFIEHPISKERLSCVSQSEGYYKRSKHLSFDPFSLENKEAVNRIILELQTLAEQHGIHYDIRR